MSKDNTKGEPLVLTEDVRRVLRRVIQPDADSEGESVALIAARADTSTRTVYRVLAHSTPTLKLDIADRLCLAADGHLSECRIYWGKWPDGKIADYLS